VMEVLPACTGEGEGMLIPPNRNPRDTCAFQGERVGRLVAGDEARATPLAWWTGLRQ